jgi:hypothetical protein
LNQENRRNSEPDIWRNSFERGIAHGETPVQQHRKLEQNASPNSTAGLELETPKRSWRDSLFRRINVQRGEGSESSLLSSQLRPQPAETAATYAPSARRDGESQRNAGVSGKSFLRLN